MTVKENVPLDTALGRILLPSLNAEEKSILQGVLQDSFGSIVSSHDADLEEALASSGSVILVGPPGSGKTSAVRRAAKDTALEVICPLALDAERLFGRLDRGEWHDGVVTSALRSATKWLLFDGPLQPWWAEALHSALDDAPKLNLASGEALRVPPNIKILLETQDISEVRNM